MPVQTNRLEEALEVGRQIQSSIDSMKPKRLVSVASFRKSNITDFTVGDDWGVFSIAISTNGKTAAAGMGNGSLQVKY